jgi:RimJ/RimL family protein N-acetyltransferase
MELRDITMGDLPLYEALLTDPGTMSELGGPLPREALEAKLRGIVDDVAAGRIWYLVVLPDGSSDPAGTVCIWDHNEEGSGADGGTITEIGWMVLPRFQGRGIGSRAVRATLDRARREGRWSVIHAFPGVTNVASNRICEKHGFTRTEEADIEYVGRTLRCNHWVLDLGATPPP